MINKFYVVISFFVVSFFCTICVAEITLMNASAHELAIFIEGVTSSGEDDPLFQFADTLCILGPVAPFVNVRPIPVGARCFVPFAFQGASFFTIEIEKPGDLREVLHFYVKYDRLRDNTTYTVTLCKCPTMQQCGEFFCEWQHMPDSWCLCLTTNTEESPKPIWLTQERDDDSSR